MNRRTLLARGGAALLCGGRKWPRAAGAISQGRDELYIPTEASLQQHRTPEWFRDAKFGFTAQWTPQSLPEQGDWYARNMYVQGSPQYEHHLANYGHPSRAGYKDLCRDWKGESWEPAGLLDLYQSAGARYFVALANHHDGFDCWNSRFQPWNSVAMGPKRDIIGTWAPLARKRGLRFGAEVFSAQNWDWFQVSHGSDSTGPMKGVPYDGQLTARDGEGQWWSGLDPAALYGPAHLPGAPPDAAYCRRFFDRTADLLQQHQPDLIFYTERGLPLGQVGLQLAALQFNASRRKYGRSDEAVVCTKHVPRSLRAGVVCDMLPGDVLEPEPWQMDICIGDWHYKRDLDYKTAADVIPYLVDVVSKNGNLLLNIPIRADGSIDERERAIVEDIGRWMKINGEALFETRPWQIFGEGPTQTQPVDFPYRTQRYTPADIRFTMKKEILYSFALGRPADGTLRIASLGRTQQRLKRDPASVEMLGVPGPLQWMRTDDALVVTLPRTPPTEYVFVLRLRLQG